MRGSRGLVLVASLCVFACAAAGMSLSGVAQGVADIVPVELTLAPAASVFQGDPVDIIGTVVNQGQARAESFVIRFSWRRMDREAVCGAEEVLIAELALGATLAQVGPVRIDTSTLLPGRYEIAIWVDPRHEVDEGPVGEANNRLTRELTINPRLPELYASTLEFLPGSPAWWGQTVGLSTRLFNSGPVVSGDFTVRFQYYPLLLTDGGQSAQIARLEDVLSGEQWMDFATLYLPGLDALRDTEVMQALDTLVLAQELWGLPEVQSAVAELDALDASSCDAGSDCLTRSELLLAISVQVDGPENGSDSSAGCESGSCCRGEVCELDERNNRLVALLTIEPSDLDLPELRPVRIVFDRDMPFDWNQGVDADVLVTNTGARGTNPGIPVEVQFRTRRLDPGVQDWVTVSCRSSECRISPPSEGSALGVEEDENSDEVDVRLTFAEPGRYEIEIEVDPQDRIREIDETNNVLRVTVSVWGTELHPQSIELDQGPIRHGDTIQIRSLIENTGERPAEAFNVGFFIDGRLFDVFHYSGELRENEQVTAQGMLDTSDLPAGDYTLRIVVDPDNQLPEMDEGNNVMTMPLTVLEALERDAELHPVELSVLPASPVLVGEGFTLVATVRNTGAIAATAFQVRLSVEDAVSAAIWSLAEEITVDGLAKGSRVRLMLPVDVARMGTPPQDGQYLARVLVDPVGESGDGNGQIREEDELNNEMIISFRIGLPSPVSPAPETANPGFDHLRVTPNQGVGLQEELTVTGAIRNSGREDAPAFLVALWWEGAASGPAASSIEVPGLEAGGLYEFELTIPGPSAPGVSTLVGRVDPDERIPDWPDDDEARVTVEATGEIKADLYVSQVRFSGPLPVLLGEPITAYATVENHGLLPSGPFQVSLQQEGSTLFIISQSVDLRPNSSIEIPFALDTSGAGSFTLVFLADVGGTVEETSEANNSFAEATLVVVDTPPAVAAERLTGPGEPTRFLEADTETGAVFAASPGGGVVAYDRGAPAVLRFDVDLGLASDITDLEVVPGDALYVVTAGGEIVVLGLDSGAVIDEISLPVPDGGIRTVAVGSDRTIYVGTDSGVIAVDRVNPVMNRADGITGPVEELLIDPLTGFLYARTTAGLFVLDTSLDILCQAGVPSGSTTAMAIGGERAYIGTDDGFVHVYRSCGGTSGSTLETLWSFPADGALAGAVTSIVVDLRGADPIYVTTSDGLLVALNIEGTVLWVFEAGAGIVSAPAVDRATRRLHFADVSGVPYVLEGDGREAFEVNGDVSRGVDILSPFAVTAFDLEVDGIIKHFRAFYYGGDDGAIYVIQTDR
ncbi:MAG: PQQ-binding-like beta-propeller repeat protein [Candidatus Bipolaricaulota bacterium]|nr:MAG: PQQ-binding-like beta-propeller repeat protein [Candidatus Bipolaricaulota bacterium]